MKVLIGCEFSGTVRDAFVRHGHDAMSCDLLPTAVAGPHYEGDVFDVIDYPWDLAIFHPPCTHTAVSGARHFAAKCLDGRQMAGVSFFMSLWRRSRHVPRTVFEQPVSIMSRLFRRPDQIIQPHQFGHAEFKATCLWLDGVAPLVPTDPLVPPPRDSDEARKWNRVFRMPPSADRWAKRSATYPGIAEAMASQWGRA